MARKIEPDVKTLERLAAIEDPVERLREAARTVQSARRKKGDARAHRTAAAAVLHLNYGWKKVTLYRDLFDIPRPGLDKELDTVGADLPDLTEEAAELQATQKHAEWFHQRAVEHAAYAVFLELTRKLARRNPDAEGGVSIDGVSNSALAKLTELSTARIAQIMTGRTNAARVEKRERDARQKAKTGSVQPNAASEKRLADAAR